MKYFVGIDLGTTNSAISTFDGENVRVWKSKKDQNDVTPSAIYVDKRGRRFYGKEAYLKSFQQPERCATLFKRFMGTSTKIKIGDEELTPEECSAEILRELFKNLPEEIRENKDEVGTIITVPAAFNQMQNAATLDAAKQAGLGKVALMQEPVAAIMRVMKDNQSNGNFLIFDLGGGTLDVAIAERISGKVNFLAHGGIAMCGGRDFDRILMNEFVAPWLKEKYSLPKDWSAQPKYKKLRSFSTYMTELAKIELSSDEHVKIEGETGIEDEHGEEIYLDVTINRAAYDRAIAEPLIKAIEMLRETIKKSGLTANDIDKIIFIGGPTNYKPLRDKVVSEVGIPGSIEVNPMTAVSEGAAIFAESVDWNSQEHERKATREQTKRDEALGLSFRYESRTPGDKAKIATVLAAQVKGYTFEISSIESGWISDVIALKNNAVVTVPLHKRGENKFVVKVYDNTGSDVRFENDTITIVKTFANVGALLASHSIGLEVKERIGSNVSRLDYLIREGDTLPAKGQRKFRSAQKVRAGSSDSINFKMWEGEIEDNIEDNRFIGQMKISGEDFDFGAIIEGTEIICNYTIDEAGSVTLDVEIPSIAESFNSGKNFYSRSEGQLNLDDVAGKLNYEGQNLLERVRDLGKAVEDDNDYEKLQQAGEVASTALSANQQAHDREELQHIVDDIQDAKKKLNEIRRNNLHVIREQELEQLKDYYDEKIKKFASPQETAQFEKLFAKAESLIERPDSAFENILQEVRYRNYDVLAKSDEFIVVDFVRLTENPYAYDDRESFEKVFEAGKKAIEQEDIVALRKVVNMLWFLKGRQDDDVSAANIVRA